MQLHKNYVEECKTMKKVANQKLLEEKKKTEAIENDSFRFKNRQKGV